MSGIKRVDVNVKNSELQNQNVMIGVRKEEVKSSTSRFHYNWCMYVLHDQTLYDAFYSLFVRFDSNEVKKMAHHGLQSVREKERDRGRDRGRKKGNRVSDLNVIARRMKNPPTMALKTDVTVVHAASTSLFFVSSEMCPLTSYPVNEN